MDPLHLVRLLRGDAPAAPLGRHALLDDDEVGFRWPFALRDLFAVALHARQHIRRLRHVAGLPLMALAPARQKLVPQAGYQVVDIGRWRERERLRSCRAELYVTRDVVGPQLA